MTKALTYVEIDVPTFAAASPDSTSGSQTFRFAQDVDYLPNSISAIPSIMDVSIQPQTISLGENLGQRGVVTITFRDHLHIFASEAFTAGTFWGKFRARYGQRLQGRGMRLIRGTLGQALEEMQTRYFTIDSTDGPTADRRFKIIGNDVLSLANITQAQAPIFSLGFMQSAISAGDGVATLSPAGIGNSTYPTSPAGGYINLGGTEIAAYSRSGDTLGISRGFLNTTAVAHAADERAQHVLFYEAYRPVDIIYELLNSYTDIYSSVMPLAEWQAENDAYLNVFYTAYIPEPKPVSQLVSEIIEQAGLAMWWDDIGQKIRIQVLRQISAVATTYDEDNTLKGTLEVTEQPETRLSDVQVYFSLFNPLIQDDEDDNYRSTASVSDATAITQYGSTRIKKIRSRWIPAGGRTSAEITANKQLGRFRDPPRAVKFSLPRDQDQDPALGGGYQLGGHPFQNTAGVPVTIPIQITRLNRSEEHTSEL